MVENELIEKTLVLVKPDGVQRGLIGEVISRFEKIGVKIIGMKMISVDKKFAEEHYNDIKERKGDKVLQMLLEYCTMGPVVAMVLEGVDIVEVVRKVCGPTEPNKALPGTIRGDFAHANYNLSDTVGQAVRNIVHASGTKEEAEFEISHWFNENELLPYTSVHDVHILHKEVKKE